MEQTERDSRRNVVLKVDLKGPNLVGVRPALSKIYLKNRGYFI